MSMFNPKIDKVVQMCTHISDKHVGEINTLSLDWHVLELMSGGDITEQVVPVLNIDFK